MPHYDRNAGVRESTAAQGESIFDDDRDAMEEAAQALREAELEAVKPTPKSQPATRQPSLEDMSIDELRVLAAKLDVPNRGAITQQDELIAAIRERQ